MAALLLSSCAREAWRVPLVAPNDSLPLMVPLQAKKVTITGPVNFITQLGTGNTATPTATDNHKAGQRATAPAIGAASSAAVTEPPTPWYLYGMLAVLLVGAGYWLYSLFPLNSLK